MAAFTKAIKINLNMGGNTLSNVVIGSYSSAPSALVKGAGYIYFDTAQNKFGVCTGFTGEGQDRHPTWAYMETVAAVESKLATMRASLAIAKHSETATGIDISIAAEGETKTSTLYLDGLMTAVAAVNTKPNPAHASDPSAPENLSGRFLQVTKTGNNGVADQISYVDLPDEVTSGALDETASAEKIALTLSDGSTVNIDLTSLYTKLNQQALNVGQTNSVTLTKTGGTSGTATTITADVNISNKTGNAISTIAAQAGEGGHTAGLFIEKTTTIAASGSTSDNKLATESAVRSAVDAVESQEMHSLTNKWFDAQGTGNKLSNVDANNFDSDAMALTEAEAAAQDKSGVQFTSLEKVNALIASAQTEAVRYRGAWTITVGGSVEASTTGTGISACSADLVTFKNKVNPSAAGNYVFTFDGTDWHLGDSTEAANLAEYGVSFTGTAVADDTITVAYSTTPAATSDMSGLTLPIKKGDFFLVNGTGPVTIGGVEFNPGDHIVANTNIASGGTATVSNFDKVDNTESADLVRKDASQILTNKGIDADDNNISNLEVDNFKDGVIVTTVGATGSDSAIPTEQAVREAIAAAAPGVDNITVETFDNHEAQGGSDHDIRVKAGGISITHMNSSSLELGTGDDGESQANAKLPSKIKVDEMIVAERSAEATLKKKTLDLDSTSADKNIIQNAELGIFASGVVQETVRATGSATNTSLATEAAVRAAINALDTAGVHSYVVKNEANSFIVDNESNVQSATWTLSAPAGANHNKLHATLIEATTAGGDSGREVDCDIQYNTANGTVIFGINCDSKPAAGTYIAVILG